MRCYQRLLNIPYKNHVTNETVRRKIQAVIGGYDELLIMVWLRLGLLVLQSFYRTQRKNKEEVDRGRGGNTILKSEKEWILPAQLRQPKTGQGRNSFVVPRRFCKVMGKNRKNVIAQ